MNLLLDTQLSIWSIASPERIASVGLLLIQDPKNTLYFSTICIWETSIKFALGKPDFQVDPATLRSGLLTRGDRELLITSDHAIAVASLPLIHRDPFDRLLLARAKLEGMVLLTVDMTLASYGSPVRLIR